VPAVDDVQGPALASYQKSTGVRVFPGACAAWEVDDILAVKDVSQSRKMLQASSAAAGGGAAAAAAAAGESVQHSLCEQVLADAKSA